MPGRVQELTEQLLKVIDSEGNVRRVSGWRGGAARGGRGQPALLSLPVASHGRHFNLPLPAAGSGHGGGGNGRVGAGEDSGHGGGPQGGTRGESGAGGVSGGRAATVPACIARPARKGADPL